MADLPASTAAVVDDNASSLSDLVTQLTVGVNLTPLSWILLAELLILGVVAGIFAVRLVQRRRKELIDAISQMIEHYTRRADGYIELQQKDLEERFQLDPEKAALASNQMLQNQQTFLYALSQTLMNWDMHRLSRIHMELEQLNHDQLTTIATGLGFAAQPEATEENDYFDEPAHQPPVSLDEESDELLMAETEIAPEIEAEQEFEFTFEETPPPPAPEPEPELELELEEEESLEFTFEEEAPQPPPALDSEPEKEETFEFNFDEAEEPEPVEEIEIPAPKPPRHRNEEIDLLVPENPEIIIDEPDALAALGLSAEELGDLNGMEIVMEKDMGSLNHPNPIRKKKKTE